MAMPFASLSPAADHHRPSPISRSCRPSPLYSSSSFGEESPHHQHQHQHQHQQPQPQAHAMRWAARPAPFTAAQYEELEQQALIYKYLVAGVPVPPDLLLPIRRGFDSLLTSSRFYHLPALGYGSYFGKKLDPEPGRCRRTDGKKWRCSKEAAHDSKYCERHMHRGRNRSRKPVETQLVASPHLHLQQQTPSSAAAFQSHSPYPAIATGGGGGCGTAGSFALGSTQTQLHMDNAAPYATAGAAGNKDFRYSAYGVRASAIEEHNQLITAAMETAMDNYSWRLMPTQTSAFSLSSYPMLGTLGDLDQSTICSLPKAQREPLSFFGSGALNDDDSAVKQENQTLRPFFDEWPKARDSWPELRDHNINNNSNNNINAAFSATKLSISIPMTSSDFSTTGSRSPHGIYSR